MSFSEPVRLLLLLGVALLLAGYVAVQARRRTYAVRFTELDLLDELAPKRPGWRRHLVAALHLVVLAALVLALAGPQREEDVPRERATVMLAVDVSLSMEATDVEPNRLESAQAAAVAFLDEVPDRFRVGVVSFSGEAKILVSPTTDRAVARQAIENLRLEPATAIGEAIYTSLDAIATVPVEGDEVVPAAIVLMSDGETTVGRDNLEAARAAEAAGVPVSTIAFGTPDGVVGIPDEETGIMMDVPVPVAPGPLEDIAEATGGNFFTAETADELSQVYESIGSSLGTVEELRSISGWFVAAALLLGLAGSVLALRWFARLP
jgi:Ca-activated chloride channel family protein